MNAPTLTQLHTSLTMAETEERKVVIALQRCEGLVAARLYMVTLTRQDEGKYPAVSLHYVIAPSEQEAIAQCECLPFPECSVLGMEERARLTATAQQIPVMLRGWGRQTF